MQYPRRTFGKAARGLQFLALVVSLCLAFSAHGGTQQATDGTSATGTAASAPSSGQQTSGSQPAVSQPAGGQQAAQKTTSLTSPYESSGVIQVHTRLVTLDVVATDAHGNAISDLKAKDFTVLEDGKPQSVRAFGFQHPIAPDPKRQVPALPPNVFTNIPQFPLGSALNVILMDVLNTPLADQAYARGKLLHYVDNMPPNEPTAVYILGSRLKLVHDFTIDHAALKEAVQATNIQSSLLLDGPEEEIPGAAGAAIGAGDAQRNMEQLRRTMRIDMTLKALQTIAHTLAGYDGRKNLIWISAAFPLSIDPNFTLDPQSPTSFDDMENHSGKVAKTAQVMTDSQVAIYPVDPRGLVAYSTFSAASRGPGGGGREFGNALLAESRRLTATHDTMNVLAENTGGKAFYNRNDLDKAIYDSVTDGSTYYMLGYYPENKKWDGKFRKVQIKVNRPGIKLRYRLGYYASDPQPIAAKPNPKQRARDLGEALSLDQPNSTALFFAAGVLPPSAQTQNQVIINYSIAPRTLLVNPGNDGLEHAEVECLAQAYNEKGKPAGTANISTEQASMKPETLQKVLQTGFPCRNQMQLPAGSYRLRLIVRDARTGAIGTSDARVTVPPAVAQTKAPQDTKKAQ